MAAATASRILNGDTGLIALENKPREFELTVGAVVVATGFSLYEPHQGEYGYGEHPEVMTLAQLIRLLALNEGKELVWNGRSVHNIALHPLRRQPPVGRHQRTAAGWRGQQLLLAHLLHGDAAHGQRTA